MTRSITDTGQSRIVDIEGEQHGYGGGVHYSHTETHYSRETLEAILAIKGEMWLRDEIARGEEPGYVELRLRRQFDRFIPIWGQRVLDFGCGCGGSSLCLARLGASAVVGIEPQSEFVMVARLRARDSHVSDRVTFRQLTDTTHLPFPDGHFTAVVMNAVVEHIPPRERKVHLQEVWRVLAPGGHLFISETPNRWWPHDGHTTGLWWIPYMPLALARRYAIARGAVPADATMAWLLAAGLRGGSYWEIMRGLGPDARHLRPTPADDLASFWGANLARPNQSAGRVTLKRALYGLHRLACRYVLRPLGIPDIALLPELSMCVEKGA